MSSKYPGGIISKTAPTPSGPYSTDTAPGVWTLEQQAYWQKLGQWPTAGNVNPNAFIENLFSTYLYTGTGAALTITNGIDLSTNGGMVWLKSRSLSEANVVVDSARGPTFRVFTNSTAAEANNSTMVSAFTSTGFSLGSSNVTNTNASTNVSWTFREQPKFFDVVTFTSSASGNKTFSHNLGSTPGCVIIKNTQTVDPWIVYHRSVGNDAYLSLNTTDASSPLVGAFSATSTTFTISSSLMYNSQTYVAYLFAHDAGGFGLTGTDNVISCGSYIEPNNGSFTTVTLGYEPQWLLVKCADQATTDWNVIDTMRGMVTGSDTKILYPNLSAAEGSGFSNAYYQPTATGFTAGNTFVGGGGKTVIYIAIRRGPMAVPTLGTSVFSGISRSGTGATVSVTGAGFPPDAIITKVRNLNGAPAFWDKLRGPNRALTSNTADAEQTTTTEISSFNQDGFSAGTSSTFYTNASGGYTYINWQLKRAPSFFDEVCYTGTGSATTFSHNLQAVPELMICKRRNISASWIVYSAATGNSAILQLEDTGAVQTSVTNWNNTTPTASVFSVGTQGSVNASGGSYVAYLFATCAGVSKVGSYTGTGTLTTVNCGFTGGARFVLIKRTDAVEAWYVWDTIRGMTAGTDPSLRFNNQSSESNANSVYSIATGFQLLASPSADVNTNGGTYIFLAIA